MQLTQSELRLVKQAVAGDQQALGQLLKSHREYLYRTAYLYVGNQADALDVIQEATALAARGISHLSKPEYFFTWFTRILIRQAQKLYDLRQKEVVTDAPPESTAPAVDLAEKLDLLAALQGLHADYRHMLQLYYYQDMSVKEISQLLDLPEGTVKTRLRRGRLALHDELGGNYYG